MHLRRFDPYIPLLHIETAAINAAPYIQMKGLALIKYLTLINVFALCSSCSPFETGDISSANLVVENTSLALRLKNDSQTSLRYFVIEDRAATMLDMEYEPWTYPQLKPNERVVMPIREVLGYREEASIIRVFWVTEEKWDEGTLIFVEL